MDYVQFLSTLVDLSRLDQISFNPDFTSANIDPTMECLQLLIKLAHHMSTLAIHPHLSYAEDEQSITDRICSIIPHHLKYLEVTVNNVNGMIQILDYHPQLCSVTFVAHDNQSLPWSDLINVLLSRKRDFVYWESYYSLRIWFGQSSNQERTGNAGDLQSMEGSQ